MNNLQRKKRAFMSIITRPLGFVRTVSGIPPLSLPYAMEGKADSYVIEGKSVQEGKNLWTRGNLTDISVNTATDILLGVGSYTLSAIIDSTSTDGKSLIFGYKVSNGSAVNLGTISNNTGLRESCILTVTEPMNKLRIYAASTSANSTSQTFTATDIQLEKGTVATEWQSPIPSSENPIEIKSVGEETVNLLPFPFTTPPNVQSSFTSPISKNGVTYTPNNDGSITINGTSTAALSVYLWANKTSLLPGVKVGDTITISKNPDDVSQHANVYFTCNYYKSDGSMAQGAVSSNSPSGTKTIMEDWIGMCVYIHVPNGRTINNLTIKPQIQIGSTATPYEPYGYKLDVVNRGVNLFDVESLTVGTHYKGSYGSVSRNENGYKCVCTTSNTGFRLNLVVPSNQFEVEKTYTLSAVLKNVRVIRVGQADDINDTSTMSVFSSTTIAENGVICIPFTTTNLNKDYINLYFYGKGYAVGDELEVYNIQIQEGSVATDCEPYRPPITTPIFLDEPLRGIGDYKDKIDFESGTVERKIISKSFDGTEAWKNYNNFIYFPITGIMASSDCLCTRLPNHITAQGIGDGTLYVRPVTDSLRIVVSNNGSYTDVDEWKSLLAQWSESEMPFTVVTQLSTPKNESITLPELPLFEGTNILSIEGDIQPEMTVIYKASVKEV